MKYYFSDGHNQFGPFSKIELKSKGITKDMLVWFEGLSEWKRAGDIEELSDLFSSKQIPPLPVQQPHIQPFSESAHQQYNVTKEVMPLEKKEIDKENHFLVRWSILFPTCFGWNRILLLRAI